jgi:MoaA/NifB/PqqE/SkfB family radical SAM enzyme
MQPRSGVDIARPDFERIIDELAELGVFLVTLSGGEPFLHPNFGDMFLYAHKRFAHVMTLTNGTALRPCHLDPIQQVLNEKGAVTIQVSLDSNDAHVNALTRAPSQRTLRTIKQLTSMGCHVIVAIVVTRHNVATVVPTVESLSAHTRWFHLMTVQDIRSKPGVERELEAERTVRASLWTELGALATARDLAINYPTQDCERGCATGAPCMAGFSSLIIDPDLNVRPCDRLTDIVLGNLNHAKVSEVWNSARMLAFTQRPEPLCRSAPMPSTPLPVQECVGVRE